MMASPSQRRKDRLKEALIAEKIARNAAKIAAHWSNRSSNSLRVEALDSPTIKEFARRLHDDPKNAIISAMWRLARNQPVRGYAGSWEAMFQEGKDES